MIDHELLHLPNGIRLLYKSAQNTLITHCCLLINVGSRDEDFHRPGLAHFIEHLLFKGTEKRKAYQVLNFLEVVGGDLNAYTTKEQTCIHASVMNEHAKRALELMADITFHSTFPQQELEKEKGVILDEIDSYKDLPEELIQDEFDEMLFEGHPLGNSILGTLESVQSFGRQDIADFMKAGYLPSQMVVAVHSSIPFAKIKAMVEQFYGAVPASSAELKRESVSAYRPQQKTVRKNMHQAHALIGNRCYSINHQQKTAMLLLNTILGGGMSSKLNMNIREKYGIAYSIESNYSPMSDSGYFSIYMGTDKDKMDRCLHLVQKELRQLRETALSPRALQQSKQRFIGQIGLSEESRLGVIIAMAKSLLDHGRIDSLPEIYAKIEAVSAQDLLAVANEVTEESQQSCLVYLPE